MKLEKYIQFQESSLSKQKLELQILETNLKNQKLLLQQNLPLEVINANFNFVPYDEQAKIISSSFTNFENKFLTKRSKRKRVIVSVKPELMTDFYILYDGFYNTSYYILPFFRILNQEVLFKPIIKKPQYFTESKVQYSTKYKPVFAREYLEFFNLPFQLINEIEYFLSSCQFTSENQKFNNYHTWKLK